MAPPNPALCAIECNSPPAITSPFPLHLPYITQKKRAPQQGECEAGYVHVALLEWGDDIGPPPLPHTHTPFFLLLSFC
jgi:hypothetical protein